MIPVLLDLPQVRIADAQQTVSISIADVETATLLGVPQNAAVGEVCRVFLDAGNQILYFAEITYRADYVRFQMQLRTEP